MAFWDGRYPRAQDLAEAAIRNLPSDANLMVFEPATLAVHVGFGPPPTTARAPVRIDLSRHCGGPV